MTTTTASSTANSAAVPAPTADAGRKGMQARARGAGDRRRGGPRAARTCSITSGRSRALPGMADDIIGAQTKEVEQMRGWRSAWYGSAGTSDDSMHGHGSEEDE
jgi:hypothetical protein